MSLADYQGRTFDLLVLRGGTTAGDTLLSQTLFDTEDAGEICTGIQKLAQRWVLEFLTRTGSMPFLPTRGCDFLADVLSGRLQTELDVEQAFLTAALQVAINLQAEETTDMPADERLSEATLNAIGIADGRITLSVTITSLAGSSRAVILPVSTVTIQPIV